MKTRDCQECMWGFYCYTENYKDGDKFTCLEGHKPRFYMPRDENPYNYDWGYKRKCGDFVLGKHVMVATTPQEK